MFTVQLPPLRRFHPRPVIMNAQNRIIKIASVSIARYPCCVYTTRNNHGDQSHPVVAINALVTPNEPKGLCYVASWLAGKKFAISWQLKWQKCRWKVARAHLTL